MNKKLKIFFKVLLGILFFITLCIFIIFIVHKIKNNIEYNELKKYGYISKYSAGDYDLNIYRIGNKNSKHKLIAISGLGVNDFSIEMSFVNEKLKDNYELIYIDRAGYGYSDDTSKKQTVEQIVSDYRNAIKNAGIDGPFILMPHSLGGVYATYWESMYPDEIEGVILIDSTEIGQDVWDEEEFSVDFIDYLELLASKIGLQRFVLRNYVYTLPDNYSKEEQKISDYINIHSITNKAKLSEIKEMNNNTNKTYKSIKSNDIPKIYISSSAGYRNIDEYKEYINWVSERQKENGLKIFSMPFDQTIEDLIDDCIKWEEIKIKPYIDLLGNTRIVLLPGDHMIFEQKPDELASIIEEFVDSLD